MPNTASNDELAVTQEISGPDPTSHACARTIASWYADTQPGVLEFTSTGAITIDASELYEALTDRGALYRTARPDRQRALDALHAYLIRRAASGQTARVPGWSSMWIR